MKKKKAKTNKQTKKTITYPNASTWKSIKTFEHSGGACKRKLSIEYTVKLNFKQPQHASPNGWSMVQWHLQKTKDFHYWPKSVRLLDPGFGILICGKHLANNATTMLSFLLMTKLQVTAGPELKIL